MARRKHLSRRTFLRGMLMGSAVTIGLPPLEAMLNTNGTAFADGAIPSRFGVWFWGNGTRPERWVPSGTGTGWTASEELQPLEGVRDWLSVVSGTSIKTGTHPHHAGMTGVMTGMPLHQVGITRDTIVSTFDGPSVDVIAANHFDGVAPFRSLELGITRFRGTDEGTTFQHLSHNGPNNVNPSEYSPPALYSRLFGAPLGVEINYARQSVLDVVADQIATLETQVGQSDRIRLEQHFQSIRDLERVLDLDTSACDVGPMPVEIPDIDGREQIAQKNRTMSDMLALALACDLTRTFSVLFSSCGSGVIVWQVGAANSLHQICHDEPLPQPTVHAATIFTMEQLAYFLGRLAEIPEGDGVLLDNCSILCTSEHSDGWTHSFDEFPLLIAGKGCGRLRGGVHYRSPNNESVTRGVLTALRGAGVPATSFGIDGAYTTDSISELET